MFLAEPRSNVITFAEPGATRSFTESVADLAGKLTDGKPGGGEDPFAGEFSPTTPGGERLGEAYGDLFRAAERETMFARAANGRRAALAEAAANRIDIVRQATGTELRNPYLNGYEREARARLRDARERGEDVSFNRGRVDEEQLRIFQEQLDDAATRNPEQAAALNFYQPLEAQAAAIASNAEDAARTARERVAAAGGGAIGSFLTEAAGSVWGSRRDGLFMASLFAGPAFSTAETALARIAQTAATQAFFNAGVTAAGQPDVQAWRAERGRESGVVPALEEVGMAFLVGGVLGGGIQGGIELKGPIKAALERITSGRAQAGDVGAVAGALKLKLDPELAATVRMGEDALRADRAAGDVPPGVPADRHAEALAQAVRHAEDPLGEPPPEIVYPAPQRPRDQARIIDEAEPVELGAREIVEGKPVTFGRFDPRELNADAATFQYKGGGDVEGVTDRLRHVTQWDPLASGKTLIFERADGARFVADGHQRLGLARRLQAESDTVPDSVKLDGFLFREADGWTPADVRALAAKKNMQEGSGDAIDAARILRERPDLIDGKLPISSPMMKQAMALARLSDDAFGMTLNGVVPPNYAAAVGAMVKDPLQHSAVMADLARFAPETEREARILIGEALAAGFRAEEQISLFGAAETTRSLLGERVKVLDRAIAALSQDKRLFGTLAKQADVIEEAGNQLARSQNRTRAETAAQLADLITRLAQRTGPVSDALNRAAQKVAENGRPGTVAREFLDQVEGLLERDGIRGLLADPELKPRATVEPGTREAADFAAGESPAAVSGGAPAETPARAERPPASPLGQEKAIPTFRDFIQWQRGVSLEDLHARAQALQLELVQAAEPIVTDSGATFRNPGVKSIDTAREKLARKAYEDAGQVTDLARVGFVVHSPAQADAVVEGLAARFEILDEGWKAGPTGYTDRKLLARAADGTIGEIQIIPAPMYAAKTGGGQRLYTQSRSLPAGPTREAAIAAERELYAAAAAELGEDWAGTLARSSGPNSGSKVARQSASDMTADVLRTSSASTADQGAPRLSTANAEAMSADSTAGRQSQLQKVKEGIETDIARDAAGDKGEVIDMVAVAAREDGRDARFITREAAIAEADQVGGYADLVASCKTA